MWCDRDEILYNRSNKAGICHVLMSRADMREGDVPQMFWTGLVMPCVKTLLCNLRSAYVKEMKNTFTSEYNVSFI